MHKSDVIYTNQQDLDKGGERDIDLNLEQQENKGQQDNEDQADKDQQNEDQNQDEQSSEERDIVLDIGKVKVEEIKLKVEELKAKISVTANVAQLVNIQVGADVCIDKVDVEIRGVEAEAHLRVKLNRVQDILNRALDTIDRNADVLKNLGPSTSGGSGGENGGSEGEGVLQKVGDSVANVVDTAKEKVGGAVENLTNTDVPPNEEEEDYHD